MNAIEEQIGYTFKNKELLKKAFIHSSYANENNVSSSQRLEFLGDSVLGLIISEYLFLNYNDDEGILTKYKASIVGSSSLTTAINKTEFFNFLKLGSSLKNKNSDFDSLKEDLFESILGAIYLDGGLPPCKNFVFKFLDIDISIKDNYDFKTMLQEIVQAKNSEMHYQTKKQEEEFEAIVVIDGKEVAKGKGKSKKLAEKIAAKTALNILNLKG